MASQPVRFIEALVIVSRPGDAEVPVLIELGRRGGNVWRNVGKHQIASARPSVAALRAKATVPQPYMVKAALVSVCPVDPKLALA